MSEITTGTRVEITKGRFAGIRGTVWMVTKAEVGVDFDTAHRGDGNACVRKASVRVLK